MNITVPTVCCNCGKIKEIMYRGEYAYKIKDGMKVKYFCSYGCMRKYQKKSKEGVCVYECSES